MKLLSTVACVIALSTTAYLPTEAVAAPNFSIVIGNAPPPPRFERVPAARRGYIWAPGFWAWSNNRHVWQRGHWERSRYGQTYFAPQWVQESDGWHQRRGEWRREEMREHRRDEAIRRNENRMDRHHYRNGHRND